MHEVRASSGRPAMDEISRLLRFSGCQGAKKDKRSLTLTSDASILIYLDDRPTDRAFQLREKIWISMRDSEGMKSLLAENGLPVGRVWVSSIHEPASTSFGAINQEWPDMYLYRYLFWTVVLWDFFVTAPCNKRPKPIFDIKGRSVPSAISRSRRT